MGLSRQHIDIIVAHPLNWNELDQVRGELRGGDSDSEATASLLIKLVGTQAAFHL